MADNGRWFKLWCSSINDPALDNLSIEDFGRWAKIGAIIKEQGQGGEIIIQSPARSICANLQVESFATLVATLSKLPNLIVSHETDEPVSYSIKFLNWHKYQGDLSSDRVRKFRAASLQNETPKRRGEERRRDVVEITKVISPSKGFQPSDDAYRLAAKLFSCILINNPNSRLWILPDADIDKRLQEWAKHMDFLIRLDKRDPHTIAKIIRWATEDSFWQANILSGRALREKWDMLYTKATQKKVNGGNGVKTKPAPLDKSALIAIREMERQYEAERSQQNA